MEAPGHGLLLIVTPSSPSPCLLRLPRSGLSQTFVQQSVCQGFHHGIVLPILGDHQFLFVPGQPSVQIHSSQFTIYQGTILRQPGEPFPRHVGVILVLLTFPTQHLIHQAVAADIANRRPVWVALSDLSTVSSSCCNVLT